MIYKYSFVFCDDWLVFFEVDVVGLLVVIMCSRVCRRFFVLALYWKCFLGCFRACECNFILVV